MPCLICLLATAGLEPCLLCEREVCANCSLPAMTLDEDGKIREEVAPVGVICSRCNPPNHGTNAKRRPREPEPVGGNGGNRERRPRSAWFGW